MLLYRRDFQSIQCVDVSKEQKRILREVAIQDTVGSAKHKARDILSPMPVDDVYNTISNLWKNVFNKSTKYQIFSEFQLAAYKGIQNEKLLL